MVLKFSYDYLLMKVIFEKKFGKKCVFVFF